MIRDLFNRQYAKKDILAGLTLAVESVPDGMAVGTLAAISPMNGVYAYMIGGLSGAFFTSSVSLRIQATSAMALIVAGVPEAALEQPTAKDRRVQKTSSGRERNELSGRIVLDINHLSSVCPVIKQKSIIEMPVGAMVGCRYMKGFSLDNLCRYIGVKT